MYDPFEEIRRLHEYIDRMFGELFARTPSYDVRSLTPPVDVIDEGGVFRIVVEVPGVRKEDLDVRVTEDSVVIRAERKFDRKDERKNYYLRERSYSSYYRVIRLPEPVIPEKAEAEYRNGILEIVVPKRAPERSDTEGFRVKIK